MSDLEPTQYNWADFAKVFTPLAMLFALVWKYIDKSFADKASEREAMLKKVAKEAAIETVKEAMKEFVMPINDTLKSIDKKVDDGLKHVNDRIDDLLKSRKP